MTLSPLHILLRKLSVKVLCPLFNWVVCLPRVEFLIYFGDQTLVWGIIGKYDFPYNWFSFHFNVVFFSHADAFYFDEVPFVYSFLYVPCFLSFFFSFISFPLSYLFFPLLLFSLFLLFLSLSFFFINWTHYLRLHNLPYVYKLPLTISTAQNLQLYPPYSIH